VLWDELVIVIVIVEGVFIVEGVWGVGRAGSSQHWLVPVLLARPCWWWWGAGLEFHRRFGLSLPWCDAWGFGKWLRGRGIHKCSKT